VQVKGDAPRRCSSGTKYGEVRQQSPYRAHWGSQAQMSLTFSAPTLQSGLPIGDVCVRECVCVPTLDLISDGVRSCSHQACQSSLNFCDIVHHWCVSVSEVKKITHIAVFCEHKFYDFQFRT